MSKRMVPPSLLDEGLSGNADLQHMAVASGPAGPVLAGPVFNIVFGIVHAQNSINVRKSKNNDHACTSKCCAVLKLAAMLSNQPLTCTLHHVLIAII